jgi:hypothetical protein
MEAGLNTVTVTYLDGTEEEYVDYRVFTDPGFLCLANPGEVINFPLGSLRSWRQVFE